MLSDKIEKTMKKSYVTPEAISIDLGLENGILLEGSNFLDNGVDEDAGVKRQGRRGRNDDEDDEDWWEEY